MNRSIRRGGAQLPSGLIDKLLGAEEAVAKAIEVDEVPGAGPVETR